MLQRLLSILESGQEMSSFSSPYTTPSLRPRPQGVSANLVGNGIPDGLQRNTSDALPRIYSLIKCSFRDVRVLVHIASLRMEKAPQQLSTLIWSFSFAVMAAFDLPIDSF